MNYKIEISEQPSLPVLSMRIRTAADKMPQELDKIFGKIIQYLNEIGEEPSNIYFAAYYNMEMDNLDLEVGIVVNKKLPGKGDIKAGETTAGRQVSSFYKGPYKEAKSSFNIIMQWMDENGCVSTGVVYEFYYHSPAKLPESEFITKIVFPIVPAGSLN